MTPKQEKAIAALLTQSTKQEAARAAGIDPRTLRRYFEDPEFQKAYRAAFSGLVEDATRRAQQSRAPALQVLRELSEDGEEAGPVRVSAARSLLEYSLRLTEQLDIMERLKELEDTVNGQC